MGDATFGRLTTGVGANSGSAHGSSASASAPASASARPLLPLLLDLVEVDSQDVRRALKPVITRILRSAGVAVIAK